MWICKQCELEIGDEFNSCWNCLKTKAEVKADKHYIGKTITKSRPQIFAITMILMCLEFVYSVVGNVITIPEMIRSEIANSRQPAQDIRLLYIIVMGVVGVIWLIQGFFIYHIFKGKNWARMLYSVFVVLSIFGLARISFAQYRAGDIFSLINFCHIMLLAFIMGGLNELKAKEWFK